MIPSSWSTEVHPACCTKSHSSRSLGSNTPSFQRQSFWGHRGEVSRVGQVFRRRVQSHTPHRPAQECCFSIVTTWSSSTTAPLSLAHTCRLSKTFSPAVAAKALWYGWRCQQIWHLYGTEKGEGTPRNPSDAAHLIMVYSWVMTPLASAICFFAASITLSLVSSVNEMMNDFCASTAKAPLMAERARRRYAISFMAAV